MEKTTTGQAIPATRQADPVQRVQELERQVAELQKVDRAKDEFLALLSHELRTPIQAILSNAFLIKGRSRDVALTRPSEAIERQVARMSKLLDDLADVIRVASSAHIVPRTVPVQQLVQAAVSQTLNWDSHRRELLVDVPATPIYVKADSERLEQALGNVLRNAIKFSSQQSEITVIVTEEAGHATIRVRDQGVGVAPDELPHMFTLFRRAAGRKDTSGGLGIGLHIARELVEAHGGMIEARSDGVGKGCELVMRLPVTHERPASEGGDNDTRDGNGSGRALSILVVDDNRDAADSLAEVLAVYGHQVEVAYGGEQAVEIATRGGIHVALVDITMPTVSGYEVAMRIRQCPAARKTMLVAVTGWGSKADRELSKEAGFSYHLTKPIDYPMLESLLATAARKVAA